MGAGKEQGVNGNTGFSIRKGPALGHGLVLWGIVMTWAVGGVVGFVGYQLITQSVQREAESRVRDAVRVARRITEAELERLPVREEGVEIVPASDVAQTAALSPLVSLARTQGTARGFVLLDRGLCLAAAARKGPGDVTVAVRPLRGLNRLPDEIRDVVFGPSDDAGPPRATVTIFERDVRIATNVVTAHGERAVGTRASAEVAERVLGQGLAWNSRARVVDRWTIASYEPIRSIGGDVVGMIYAGLDEAPYVAEGRRDIARFLIAIATMTVLVSAMLWWLGRQVTRPLATLTSSATALGAGAPAPIAVRDSDALEIRVLGETFNRMAEQIHARTTELEASHREARKALDDYMEVLGFVAHELKSPLAGARTQLDMLDDGYVGEVPEAMRRPLAALRRALNYGLEVAHSFNQLSRADGEGFAPQWREIKDFAAEVVRPAMAEFEGAAAARRMSLELDDGAVSIHADPDLLEVVLNNLIGNAIKYGREGTAVRITAKSTAEGLRVDVRNEGLGVPPEKIPNLFRKFYRVQDQAMKATKGTGVGLYLVRRFVELHGGQVGVEGEYGSWIAFWFSIPHETPAAPSPTKA